MSIIGIFDGYPPTEPSVVSVGWPCSTTLTSVEVPPPSRVSTLSKPAVCATSAAPSAPAAGPDSTVVMGWWTTSSADTTPPLDFMMRNGTGPAWSSSRRRIVATYRDTRGFTAASTSVVIARSYSRYSRSTWLDSDTTASGCSSVRISRIRRSCAGLA